MKSRGILFKNLAAFFMLVALLCLLLPFCKITTPDKEASISGFEMIKTGARTALEYHRNGHIEDDYIVKGTITWGDLKAGVNDAITNENLRETEVAAGICILPVIFCFFAMLFTFFAIGKKSMVLPTLLAAAAVIENIFLIKGFQGLQDKLFSRMESAGTHLTLLMGVYMFTVLCGIALIILLLLWITGSFDRPESEDDSDSRDTRDKKDKDSRKERRSKGRRKKKKSGRKKKKSGKDSKDKKNKPSEENKEKDKQDDKQENKEVPAVATGLVTGKSGMFEGTKLNLTKTENGSYQFELPGENGQCSIQYHPEQKSYTVASHANEAILLKTGDGKLLFLGNGDSHAVGCNTILQVGNTDHVLKLN